MSSYITSLIKFTNHPDDFLSGYLFCNTWKSFTEMEEPGIGDSLEMAQSQLKTQPPNPIDNKPTSTWLYNEDLSFTPIFCMFAFYSKKYIHPPVIKLPKSLLNNLGKYKSAVIVTDVKKFISRINNHLPSFCYSSIHYVDFSNQRGKTFYLPVINKDRQKYGHQQEFRLYDHSKAITRNKDFNIPGKTKIHGTEINGKLTEKFPTVDMNDIAIEVPTNEVFVGVPIDLEVDWEFCHKNNLIKC